MASSAEGYFGLVWVHSSITKNGHEIAQVQWCEPDVRHVVQIEHCSRGVEIEVEIKNILGVPIGLSAAKEHLSFQHDGKKSLEWTLKIEDLEYKDRNGDHADVLCKKRTPSISTININTKSVKAKFSGAVRWQDDHEDPHHLKIQCDIV